MTADWIIAEADRLIELHNSESTTDTYAREWAGSARYHAKASQTHLTLAAKDLALAEVAHKGYGDVDTIADRILNGVSTS